MTTVGIFSWIFITVLVSCIYDLASAKGCKQYGSRYDIGDLVYSRNRCETCECTRWGIECLPFPCRHVKCHSPVKRPGECCPECGCLVDRYLYELGDKINSDDPCTDCRCTYDGTVQCRLVNCPVPRCRNPYSIKGICCKRCGCKKGRREYGFGPIWPVDRCRPCTCNPDGTITCKEPDCPEISCSKSLQFTLSGECCPKCRCLQNNQWFYEGDTIPTPPNNTCVKSCLCGRDGNIMCDSMECPEVTCKNPVQVPGQCCPVCGCLDTQRVLQNFGDLLDDPCQLCKCLNNGTIVCQDRQICPNLKCKSGLYEPPPEEPKQCCQLCRCRFGRNFYKPEEVFQASRCMTCKCHAATGRVSCEKKDCSRVKLMCTNPVMSKTECCPVCPNGPTCTFQGKLIRYGEYYVDSKRLCTCGGDPWFPNAFCAPGPIPNPDELWGSFGYPKD